MIWITLFLLFCAGPLLLWSVLLLLEIVYGGYSLSRIPDGVGVRNSCSYTVLIPAHNEAAVIRETLDALRKSMGGDGRILVVADNCSDETASLARECDAEVLERFSESERGKGYALNFGLRHLSAAPPDVVVLLDADCHFSGGAPEQLAVSAYASGRPVQCEYALRAHGGEGLGRRIALFAWRVKNTLRPAGLRALGLPCQLTGSGMAFPWQVIGSVEVPSSDLVEDMVLGLNLARAGNYPLYDPAVQVTSDFPDSADAQRSQRERWEHGHLQTILHVLPAMCGVALRRCDWRLLLMCLDLSIPPLSLMAVTFGVYSVIALVGALLFLVVAPVYVAIWLCSSFAGAAVLAWYLSARDLLAGTELLMAPVYALRKLVIYARFVRRRQVEWIRTARD